MKKFITVLLVVSSIIGVFGFSSVVFAADIEGPKATVLPDTVIKTDRCQILMDQVSRDPVFFKEQIANREEAVFPMANFGPDDESLDYANYSDILACGIKTGIIPLWMVPFYLRWVLEFIIGLAGLASVGGLVVGGYMYLFAGISSDKEKGKNALKNAVIGLVLTLTAWAIVNILISLVTG